MRFGRHHVRQQVPPLGRDMQEFICQARTGRRMWHQFSFDVQERMPGNPKGSVWLQWQNVQQRVRTPECCVRYSVVEGRHRRCLCRYFFCFAR
ncbi:hypothetical protein DYB32_010354 [Aphanomyces invadans]|uniref:Uncharacterized protein n=1 Tax=Aphanomyces invadans TaxID=157072 RepID=A0A3R7A1M6_9STRA|nr:hypothetical protein DYB32_010354 [Aphanomyces invadans]